LALGSVSKRWRRDQGAKSPLAAQQSNGARASLGRSAFGTKRTEVRLTRHVRYRELSGHLSRKSARSAILNRHDLHRKGRCCSRSRTRSKRSCGRTSLPCGPRKLPSWLAAKAPEPHRLGQTQGEPPRVTVQGRAATQVRRTNTQCSCAMALLCRSRDAAISSGIGRYLARKSS
jgi:hypothetical protein